VSASVGLDADSAEEAGGDGGLAMRERRWRASEIASACGEFRGLVSIAEQAVVTNALETPRQDMEDEPTEEIDGLEMEDFSFAAVSVVAAAQSDDAVAKTEEPIVGESDAVGVAGEVIEDVARPAERLLGVHDPIVLAEIVREGRGESRIIARGVAKGVEQFAPKDAGERTNGEEVAARAADPASSGGIETPGGHDAVQVDVERKILAPRVQDRDDAGLGSEVMRVASELAQRVGRGAEQRGVDESGTPECQRVQPVRQGEDDVDVVHGEELRGLGLEPALLGEGLALRAVAVAARAPDRALLTAIDAGLAEAPERRGAAAFDGPQGGELFAGEPPGVAKSITVNADEIRELQPAPPPPVVRAGGRSGQRLRRPGAVE
jgi:hypothetical protein